MSATVSASKRSSRLIPAGYITPMKALGVREVPTGRWLCEIKYDGYRAVAIINQGKVELWSRAHKPMTEDYPEIVTALASVKCHNAVLDGEIVALDSAGRSRFQLLQGRDLAENSAPLVYYIFDVMHLDGASLLDLPLETRKKKLRTLMGKTVNPLQLSPTFNVEPAELMKAVRKQGLEGIIAKRPGSSYEAGRRSGAWLKCKILGEQEFVIGGFTQPQNSRQFFGAILIGYYRAGKLLYAGKVGTGFNYTLLATLHVRFLKRVRAACPFENLPLERKSRFGTGMTRGEMKKVTWLKPELVAQIKFAEWTHDGLLRQPVFLGLRKDKLARDVRREADPVG
jgi:bifunctional non-homologous end joining protein LigD